MEKLLVILLLCSLSAQAQDSSAISYTFPVNHIIWDGTFTPENAPIIWDNWNPVRANPSLPVPDKYNWKRAIVPASLSFASGAAWGVNQVNQQHPEQMFSKYPNLSRKWWGPESWRNKYRGFNPENGRNATPIWFTDAQHLTASMTQLTMFGAGVSIPLCRQKGKWWHYAADAGISFASYSLGNYLTYSVIMR